MNKEEIRSYMKVKRQNISSEFINMASTIINTKFMSEFSNFESYAIYWEINGEVKTSDLINILLQKGKTIYLPVYKKNSMGFGYYNESNVLIKKNGAREPVKITELSNVDVIVVPGLSFDRECFRVGFGSGFYDRVLKNIKTKYKVGFAYDFQILDKIPADPYDEPVDVVISEINTYRRMQ
jgi:5-formyltetrahydrofolate cyclo-ligase